jgi:hypothetical protein
MAAGARTPSAPGWTAPGTQIGRTGGQARALPDTLARCLAAARRAGGGRRPARAGRRAPVSRLNPTEVRQPARAQGIEVNDRGRVRAELASRFKEPLDRLVSYGYQSHGGFTHMPNSGRQTRRKLRLRLTLLSY